MTGNSNVAKTGKTPFHWGYTPDGHAGAVLAAGSTRHAVLQRAKRISTWLIDPVTAQIRHQRLRPAPGPVSCSPHEKSAAAL